MTAHLLLTLDTAPPSRPTMTINAGAERATDPVVLATITSDSTDVAQVLIWGDVDPSANPLIQPDQADSIWFEYAEDTYLTLAAGTGRKYLYAMLRDDVLNATPTFTAFIDLDTDSPAVSVVSLPDRSRISLQAGHDVSTFGWKSNKDFVSFQVRVVPSIGSPVTAGVPLGATNGSTNVAGGASSAGTVLTTEVSAADLMAASPGDSTKVVKVFVVDGAGRWSA